MRWARPTLLALSLGGGLTAALGQAPASPPPPRQAAPSPPVKVPAKGIQGWICRLLGIDPKVYEKALRVRGPEHRPAGKRLMKLDLAVRREEMLWDCKSCWSPVRLGDGRPAVLRPDGLWSAPSGGEPARLLLAAEGLFEIVGPLADEPGRLLLVRRTGTAECPYSFWSGDERTGRLDPQADAPCLSEAELALVPHPGRQIGGQLLVTSEGHGPVRLLVATLGRSARKPLAPWLDSQSSPVDRFDAIWWSATEVLYVASLPRRLGDEDR